MGGKGAGAYGARTALKEDVHDEAGEISRGAASRRSTGTRKERGVLGGGRFTMRSDTCCVANLCRPESLNLWPRHFYTSRPSYFSLSRGQRSTGLSCCRRAAWSMKG